MILWQNLLNSLTRQMLPNLRRKLISMSWKNVLFA